MVETGLIAHGRGEAFDYLLGESTISEARRAITSASAHNSLLASHRVISINGNTAAIVADDRVKLAKICGAKLEATLFLRTTQRTSAVAGLLYRAGTKEVLGVEGSYRLIPEVSSKRRGVMRKGFSWPTWVLLTGHRLVTAYVL